MSFVEAFRALPLEGLMDQARSSDAERVDSVLRRGPSSLGDFATLLSPAAATRLEDLCRRSQSLTRQRFGKTIRLFAPLYLSNECINNCAYCGFSRDNPILRVTLAQKEVEREARALADQGFRNILLVAGEHPKFVSNGYMADCVRTLHPFIPALSLEVGPMETSDYQPLVQAGAEGLVVYQETYDRDVYGQMHTLGPKRDFDWRLATPERAYSAGFRRLGIGALYGLADWRQEAISVAAHAAWLLKHCWKAQVTVSLPRLRPCAGEFQPLTGFQDRDLVQVITALRLFLPDVGLVLSTREPARCATACCRWASLTPVLAAIPNLAATRAPVRMQSTTRCAGASRPWHPIHLIGKPPRDAPPMPPANSISRTTVLRRMSPT